MGTTSTYTTGFGEIMDLLTRLEDSVPEELERILTEYGAKILNAMKTTNQFKSKTGNLIRSMRMRGKFTEKVQRVTVSAGGPKAPHAHLIEFGHRNIKKGVKLGFVSAHPFMRTAFEQSIPGLVGDVETSINTMIEKKE